MTKKQIDVTYHVAPAYGLQRKVVFSTTDPGEAVRMANARNSHPSNVKIWVVITDKQLYAPGTKYVPYNGEYDYKTKARIIEEWAKEFGRID